MRRRATVEGARGFEVCNFPQFSANCRNCFLLVHLACLLVPCVSPLQKCYSLKLREVWLQHRNFSAIGLDAISPPPPPPRPCCCAQSMWRRILSRSAVC